jgi:hypothetical protein
VILLWLLFCINTKKVTNAKRDKKHKHYNSRRPYPART